MKRSVLNKVSQKEIPRLKRKLWSHLTRNIKERDGKERGGKCITCLEYPISYNAQGGHCIPKSVCGVFLCFHPLNLALQCGHCNRAGQGEQGKWREVIGEEHWNWLQDARKETKSMSWSDFPFLKAIELLKEGKLEEYTDLLEKYE